MNSDPRRAGASLRTADNQRVIASADVTGRLVVLVHGFTSHGDYMRTCADILKGEGHCVAILNYDSYNGIDDAAAVLHERLESKRVAIGAHGVALVGHSMGGLVCRRFVLEHGHHWGASLKGVALLGTPNRGALKPQHLDAMLKWGEIVNGVMPFGTNLGCKSTRQMLGKDAGQLLGTMNVRESKFLGPPPVLSLSGGLEHLEGRNGPIRNLIWNKVVQRMIGVTPNDGLVPEKSSDLTAVVMGSERRVTHKKDYVEFTRINHTNLAQSEAVVSIVDRWLKAL